MFRIFIETRFSAAHRIDGYIGQCGKLHGHTWKVRVQVRTEKTNDIGISIDFKEVKKITISILEKLDHQLINEIAPFDKLNPTAENLAVHLYREIGKKLENPIKIDEVTIWESEDYAVTYSEP